MTPRVLQLISSQGYYGAESMMVALARSLEARRCRCTIGALIDPKCGNYDLIAGAEKQGLRVETISCRGRWDGNSVYEIRKLMRHLSTDILHTHGYKADLYGFVSTMSSSAGLIATCHNWPDKALAMRAYASIDKFALRAFSAVATASPLILETLERSGISRAKLQLISNGLDLDLFQAGVPALRQSLKLSDCPVIGYAGRLVSGKGVQYLMECAVAVVASYPQAVFLVVGDGPQRQELEATAATLGIAGSFRFVGRRSDMPNVYASMDMLVLPSLDECMPMCILEAMASSKPVIATRVGAVPDVIEDSVSGILVEPKDAHGLGEAIRALIGSPMLRARMAAAGLERVKARFSSNQVAEQYLNLYDQVLGKQNAAWATR